MTTPNILEAAAAAWAADLSVIPIRPGTDKAPAVAWKGYQDARATLDDIQTWFADSTLGLAIVTGTISGRLELLEIEGRAVEQTHLIGDVLDASGLGDVWHAITNGWVEESPSGGIHWMYRIHDDGQPMPRNEKIARAADRLVLVETRSEGGYFVAAPTPGTFHTTGHPWAPVAGSPATTPTITREQRDAIHAVIASVLDETPPAAAPASLSDMWSTRTPTRDGDVTPGDDYEARTPWRDILEPHGWTIVAEHAGTTYWCRPGKSGGISATTGHAQDRDRFYAFTSSTNFPQETPVTKLGAYAILNHGGDHSAAARDLAARGYGHRAERHLQAVPTSPATPNATRDDAISIATAATAPELRPVAISGEADQLTDVGNAHLTRDTWRGRLAYVPDARRWADWDGNRWAWSADDATALQAVLHTIRGIPDDPDYEALMKHRLKSQSARALSNAVAILRSEPTMRIPADQFDAHAGQLNTPGGVVDLATGALTTPHPHLYHSKITEGTPTGTAPLWAAFLDQTFQGDTELIGYVQRLVGLSLLGEVREHVLPFLHGKGANGKSVFLETIAHVLGDYATEAPANLLLAGPDRHPTELATLQGRRFVTMSEINEGARFDEAKLKWLTGGDTITARFMRGDFFTFTPTHSLWIAANHRPKVTAGGHGFWRRVRLIPFTHTVPEQDRDEQLGEKLQGEADGILAWAVAGLHDYLARGLQEPAVVLEATAAYEGDEDHLGRFVAELLHIGGGEHVRVPQSEVRDAYQQWCRAEGEEEMTGQRFGRELRDRFGIETRRSHGRKYYIGVTVLRPEGDADEDDDPRRIDWHDR